MKKIPLIAIAAIVIILALAVLLFLNFRKPQVNNRGESNAPQQNTPLSAQGRTFIMSIEEQNGSKQQGTAKVSEVDGGKVKVEINLRGGTNYNVTQPVHIHEGSCPRPGAIKHRLNNLLAGASETIIETSMDALLTSGAMAINVHESDTNMGSYIACGNLPEIN